MGFGEDHIVTIWNAVDDLLLLLAVKVNCQKRGASLLWPFVTFEGIWVLCAVVAHM